MFRFIKRNSLGCCGLIIVIMYVSCSLDCGQDCTKTKRVSLICGSACCDFTRKNFSSVSMSFVFDVWHLWPSLRSCGMAMALPLRIRLISATTLALDCRAKVGACFRHYWALAEACCVIRTMTCVSQTNCCVAFTYLFGCLWCDICTTVQ